MRLIDADAMAESLEHDVELDARALDSTDLVGPEREHVQFDKDCKQNCMWYLTEQPTVPAPRWHRVEDELPKEEGRYWCAKKFAGHWIFSAAWYWNNVSDYTGVPVGEEEKADGFVFGEDVVYPDYWMPIKPPKEDA